MALILMPSPIHGVGVFTDDQIVAGVKLPLFAPGDWKKLKAPPRGTVSRYCSKEEGVWYGPKNFFRMSIGWYLNDSQEPNVEVGTWKALRYIMAGEELTIDYRLLDNKKVNGRNNGLSNV